MTNVFSLFYFLSPDFFILIISIEAAFLIWTKVWGYLAISAFGIGGSSSSPNDQGDLVMDGSFYLAVWVVLRGWGCVGGLACG